MITTDLGRIQIFGNPTSQDPLGFKNVIFEIDNQRIVGIIAGTNPQHHYSFDPDAADQIAYCLFRMSCLTDWGEPPWPASYYKPGIFACSDGEVLKFERAAEYNLRLHCTDGQTIEINCAECAIISLEHLDCAFTNKPALIRKHLEFDP